LKSEKRRDRGVGKPKLSLGMGKKTKITVSSNFTQKRRRCELSKGVSRTDIAQERKKNGRTGNETVEV